MKHFILLIFIYSSFPLKAQIKDKNLIKSLPIHLFPVNSGTSLFIYVTGDGGWNDFSKNFIGELRKKNTSIVVLDSRKYFWKARTPQVFTKDIEKIVEYYTQTLNKKDFSLIGYSFGADVTSFVPSGLQPKYKSILKATVLISASSYTDFEIKLMDLLGNNEVVRKYDVEKVLFENNENQICIFGKEEVNKLKDNLKKGGKTKVIELPGGHEYKENYKTLTSTVITFLK